MPITSNGPITDDMRRRHQEMVDAHRRQEANTLDGARRQLLEALGMQGLTWEQCLDEVRRLRTKPA